MVQRAQWWLSAVIHLVTITGCSVVTHVDDSEGSRAGAAGTAAGAPSSGVGLGQGGSAIPVSGPGQPTCSSNVGIIDTNPKRPPTDPCAVWTFEESGVCFCDEDTVGCGAHGSCVLDIATGEPSCRCQPGYVGARCDACESGLVEVGDQCVTPCAAAGMECPSYAATCGVVADSPACVCLPGFVGESCDACGTGFTAQQPEGVLLACLPDCPTCPSGRVCDSATFPPSCSCGSAYSEIEGQCVWNTDHLELPVSMSECGRWEFSRRGSNGATVSVDAGSLVLRVDGNCQTLLAATQANLPASDTFDSPALRLSLLGGAGAVLHVSFGELGSLLPTPRPEGTTITGNGEEQTVDVCIPAGVQGTRTSLTLWLAQSGACMTLPAEQFVIHQLELVSAPGCLP